MSFYESLLKSNGTFSEATQKLCTFYKTCNELYSTHYTSNNIFIILN